MQRSVLDLWGQTEALIHQPYNFHLFIFAEKLEIMASAMAAASGLSEEVLERLAGDPLSCVERVSRYYLIFGVAAFI